MIKVYQYRYFWHPYIKLTKLGHKWAFHWSQYDIMWHLRITAYVGLTFSLWPSCEHTHGVYMELKDKCTNANTVMPIWGLHVSAVRTTVWWNKAKFSGFNMQKLKELFDIIKMYSFALSQRVWWEDWYHSHISTAYMRTNCWATSRDTRKLLVLTQKYSAHKSGTCHF